MIISKTPLRVSFFGGGTDYPEYFQNHPGAVVGTTINKYVYIISLPMASSSDTRYRVTYRKVDATNNIDNIDHPVIREGLKYMDYLEPLSIATLSDLPGGTGLGSSSSFTVGFVNLISRLKKSELTRYDLAKTAIYLERDVLQENVGIQDQIHASFGGLSHYSFYKDDFSIKPIKMNSKCRNKLNESMLLVYTGNTRRASEILTEQIDNTVKKTNSQDLMHLEELANNSVKIFEIEDENVFIDELGRLLRNSWDTKKKLSTSITNTKIDDMYKQGITSGAYGGKLCGAGGCGYFLFLVPKERKNDLTNNFGAENCVDISICNHGSQVFAAHQQF